MAVTSDDIRHIAQLARLGVPDHRVPALVNELNGILDHMHTLQSVDLSSVGGSQTGNVQGMPLRDDDSLPVSLTRDRSEFAPAMRDGFFLVPRLATHGNAHSASGASQPTANAETDDE